MGIRGERNGSEPRDGLWGAADHMRGRRRGIFSAAVISVLLALAVLAPGLPLYSSAPPARAALSTNASSWHVQAMPTGLVTGESGCTDVMDVWGTSASNVFAITSCWDLIHYNGSSWSLLAHGPTLEWDDPPMSSKPSEIWGTSSDVLVAGDYSWRTAGVYRHDRNGWTELLGLYGDSDYVTSVWCSSSSNIFAVSGEGSIPISMIHHYDGISWTEYWEDEETSPNYGVDACHVWGLSSSDVFVVGGDRDGNTGVILRYDGGKWSRMDTGTTGNLNGIWGSSSSSLFAVGEGGAIVHYNGSSWTPMTSGTTANLYDIWGSSPSNVFVIGYDWDAQKNIVLHFDGIKWSPVDTGTTVWLNGIWGSSSSDIFIVGEDGTILHYGGGGSETVDFPDQNLEAAIRETIGKPTGDIYESDLDVIDMWGVEGVGITDITGLERCRNLSWLDLPHNQISDLSLFPGLSLQHLDLSYNQISDPSPLADSGFDALILSHNQISNSSGLHAMEILDLDYNQISDLSSCSDFRTSSLGLGHNQISDIGPLVNDPSIVIGTSVDLRGNPLNSTSLNTYIPALQARGVDVLWDAPTSPSATTNAATAVTQTSATLNGNLTSLGPASSVQVSFEWGLTTAYGNTTTPQTVTGTGAFSATISGLTPGTPYHFRAKAVAGDNTAHGGDSAFTTTPIGGVGRMVLVQPLNMTCLLSAPDTHAATFTVENRGDAEITLDRLLLAGRYNGGELPGGGYPDFPSETVTLRPGAVHEYHGTLTITTPGNYSFFIAYHIENPTEAERQFLDENKWKNDIDLGEGLTDADRTRQVTIGPVTQAAEWVKVSSPTRSGVNVFTGHALSYPAIPADFVFRSDLKKGDTSDDVKYLQIILNSDTATVVAASGDGSPGSETRIFGDLTKTAVIKFQEKYRSEVLAPLGRTNGTGDVALMTRMKLNRLIGVVRHVPDGWTLKVTVDPKVGSYKCEEGGWVWWHVEDGCIRDGQWVKEVDGWIRVGVSGSDQGSYCVKVVSQQEAAGRVTALADVGKRRQQVAETVKKDKALFGLADFPTELILAMVAQEASADYDNEFVSFDSGRGIMQLTTNEAVGAGSGKIETCLAYLHVDSPGIVQNCYGGHCDGKAYYCSRCQETEEGYSCAGTLCTEWICRCYRDVGCTMNPYNNSAQGIEANIMDGLSLLKEKYNNRYLLAHYGRCTSGDPEWSKCLKYGITCDEMRQISAVQRYHGYKADAQDDPQDYLKKIAIRLRALSTLFECDADIATKLAEKVQAVWDHSVELTIFSPVEVLVRDGEGRVVGVSGGEIREEIPYAFATEEAIVIPFADGPLTYSLLGEAEGVYGLQVTSVRDGEPITFSATDLPTRAGAIHECVIDWDVLSEGGRGVTLRVDSDGDGVFERTVMTDSELTAEELTTEAGTRVHLWVYLVAAAGGVLGLGALTGAGFWLKRRLAS